MDIGARIKTRRIELGITQEELAEKLHYRDKSSIHKIEAGKADLPQSKLVEFAAALDTTVAYLVLGEGVATAETPKGPSDDDIKFALFEGKPVTDEQYEEVKRFARYVRDRDIHST